MAKRKWSELPPAARCAILAGGALQFTLIGIAHGDLSRRPAELINGPKRMWRLITLVNFVGPAAYFLVGRRRDDESH